MKLELEVQYLIATIFLSFLCANIRLYFTQSKDARIRQIWGSMLCFLVAAVLDWAFVMVFKFGFGWCLLLSALMGLFLFITARFATEESEKQTDIWGLIAMFKRAWQIAKEEQQSKQTEK